MKYIYTIFLVVIAIMLIALPALATTWNQGECSYAAKWRLEEKLEKQEKAKKEQPTAVKAKKKKNRQKAQWNKWCDLPGKYKGKKCLRPM